LENIEDKKTILIKEKSERRNPKGEIRKEKSERTNKKLTKNEF